MQLSDLYDADQRTRLDTVRRTAARYRIPHPLSRVQYADGIAPKNAGRKVESPWIRGAAEESPDTQEAA